LLAPRPLDDDTLTLAQHGDELYQMPEFTSWFYEPLTRIAPYMSRYWDTNVFEAPRLGKGNHKRTERKGKLSRNEPNILLEALVTEALDELVDDRWRLLYETRLRRQAALFRFADREQDAAFVGAVAAVLHPNSQIAVQDQAFLRAMMRVSIEEFPL